jgi:hypothetical protein
MIKAAAVTEHERQRRRRPLHEAGGGYNTVRKQRPLQEAGGDAGGCYGKRAVAVTESGRPLQAAVAVAGSGRRPRQGASIFSMRQRRCSIILPVV